MPPYVKKISILKHTMDLKNFVRYIENSSILRVRYRGVSLHIIYGITDDPWGRARNLVPL